MCASMWAGRVSLFCTIIASINARSTQSTGATGKLVCDGTPVSNAKVELYTDRSASPNGLMATTTTNSTGDFIVKGHSTKYETFRPHVVISHHCHSERCERKFSMMVPDSYTKSGSKPSELFGLGSVELKRKFPTETKTCPKP
uniref:Transthyretin-like family protein n=1 Tax=Ascaris lumbricoides TaxID=6252 RepID=A0A0M3ID06_ASCLU